MTRNAPVVRALFVLSQEESVRRRYADELRSRFPDIDVQVVDHPGKAGDLIETAQVVLTFGSMMSDDLAQRALRLQWIQVLGTGIDGVADLPSLRAEVIVTRAHGIHGAAMSEAALSAMLSLARDLPRTVRCQQRKAWERWPAALLSGKTVGILGIGAIAGELAPRCKAIGMTVVGVSSTVRTVDGFDRVHPRAELRRVVRDLDHLIVLAPLSADTRHLVSEGVLAAMKPTAFLVNLARGGVVDERALVAALERGTIAGAAFDVFETEPLPQVSPLWSAPNLIVTCHQGGLYDGYVDDVMPIVERNMRCFLAGNSWDMVGRVERNKG
jgi:phosphoglycerate dehydrogenase-like enzyme